MTQIPDLRDHDLLMHREVNILSELNDNLKDLLPFEVDNILLDILNINHRYEYPHISTTTSNGISILCSQGPSGRFSHSVGGYINSYDLGCCIGTPVITSHNALDLQYEKKCNYITILHSDGSQCDLVH